jgi:hypothetical protein
MDAKAEEMFVREAKALIGLQHPAIVRCNDLLRDDNRLYLVMELVEGPSLQRLLLRGPLPDDEVRILRRRLLDGLAAVHARGIVHRDISPANIILPDGQPEAAKLIDFGVAAVDPGDAGQGRSFQGNLTYASPEQFGLFGGRVDGRSDLYSLGLVLAEAVTGEALLPGQTYFEARELRKSRPKLPDWVPGELQREIGPLLESDPRRRPESARAALQGGPGAEEEQGGEEGEEEVVEEPGWLQTVLFTATAVGIGLGIGITLWLWKFTNVLGMRAPDAPPVHTAQVVNPPAPVVVGDPGPPPPPPPKPQLPVAPAPVTRTAPAGGLTRSQILEVAARLAAHRWVCGPANTQAPCVRNAPYRADWRPGEAILGIPYDWGGIDGPEELDGKLAKGQAAGSHARHGITPCTAGMDCSGFVSYVWGHRNTHAYTTSNMGGLAARVKVNIYTDLKPGDALNRPGHHIVLFAGYRASGKPIVYEASGRSGRVVRNEQSSWSRYQGYHPLRFQSLLDP